MNYMKLFCWTCNEMEACHHYLVVADDEELARKLVALKIVNECKHTGKEDHYINEVLNSDNYSLEVFELILNSTVISLGYPG